ncbi:MAG: phosphoribosyltransferase family protein [Acidimicrobiales bacterium]
MIFLDRTDAGRRLAARLAHLRQDSPVVLGLPRGGVPVAFEVAAALRAPLDVIVVRKLGVPSQPELGMGAIGEDGVRIINDEVVRAAGVSVRELARVEGRERDELERRVHRFRGSRARIPLEDRTVVVVDDGIATGSTARAACQVARAQGAARVVLAVPVAPRGWEARLGGAADELVCLETPDPFYAIGQFYENFTQTTDEEVVDCLERAATSPVPATSYDARDDPPARDEEVRVTAGDVTLAGRLTVPAHATGLVIFAHGSGSSRHSPRNRYVADVLNHAGLATLLFDLLTVAEERDRANVFDIALLARRLVEVTAWCATQPDVGNLPVGYFGASTGAGAALWAASEPDVAVAAVVSRGGRPDLAGPRLGDVTAATLLIVGGDDDVVLELNRHAQAQLRCESRLLVVPGATHLFEEPGTLEAAAEAARDWFIAHLRAAHRSSSPAP